MKPSTLVICVLVASFCASIYADQTDMKKEAFAKLIELSALANPDLGGCSHDHEDTLSDGLYRAIARDLADIAGVEVSRNDAKVRTVGEIASVEDWELYRRVVDRYSGQIADYVVFRPGVKLMNDFKGQLTSAGYEIVETAASEKPGAIAFSYTAGVLTLTGYFLSQADADAAKDIVASQAWLTVGQEAKSGRVPCILRFTVVDRLIDVGVVFVEVDKETSERFGNMLADGKILDFELVGNFARAVADCIPMIGDSGKNSSHGGYVRVSSDVKGVIEALATDSGLTTRMAGHATFNSNSADRRAKFKNGGKMLLKVSGQTSGDVKEVEYGFTIDCNCRFVRKDELSLDLKLEQSSMPERNADTTDYNQRKISYESRVVSRVGQTVILAGTHDLSYDVKGPSGFAFLRKIPIISWIFSGGQEDCSDKHLLILVSPQFLQDNVKLATAPSEENAEVEASASELLAREVDGQLGVSHWYHVFYFWKWF